MEYIKQLSLFPEPKKQLDLFLDYDPKKSNSLKVDHQEINLPKIESYTALTIKQPWAWLIINGYKPIENRTWKTTYRGPIFIHAGKSASDMRSDTINHIEDILGFSLPIEKIKSQMGNVIGYVNLVNIVQDSADAFALPGQFHWELKAPQSISPFPAKGKLGLWKLGDR